MSKNDNRIMELKAQIEKKRAFIKDHGGRKFVPQTNCSIELDGTRYNLHAASKSDLVFLLCKLHSLNDAAKAYGAETELVICGYLCKVWIVDVLARLQSLECIAETTKLNDLEAKLNSMLSDNKKIELELEGIETLLKDE